MVIITRRSRYLKQTPRGRKKRGVLKKREGTEVGKTMPQMGIQRRVRREVPKKDRPSRGDETKKRGEEPHCRDGGGRDIGKEKKERPSSGNIRGGTGRVFVSPGNFQLHNPGFKSAKERASVKKGKNYGPS